MPVMNVASVIDSFSTGTYTVTRRARSSYVKGRDQASVTSSFTAKLCVQPLSGDDLMRLPEGMSAEETLKVFSSVELRGHDASGEPDSISIEGDEYEVQKVERWNRLGAYWSAIVSRNRR